MNNRMLSERMRLPINQVTPRVKELRDIGLVIPAGEHFDYSTLKMTKFWIAIPNGGE